MYQNELNNLFVHTIEKQDTKAILCLISTDLNDCILEEACIRYLLISLFFDFLINTLEPLGSENNFGTVQKTGEIAQWQM